MKQPIQDKLSTPRLPETDALGASHAIPIKCFRVQKTQICIRPFCNSKEIKDFIFDDQFGTYAQYKSLYTKRESLEENASGEHANVTIALMDNTIIGFGVLNYPDEGERWLDIGTGVMMEVKAIEVCRRFRSSGIAAHILNMLVAHTLVENMIVYMVGYSWTWDLDGSGKSALDYRNMLIRLFEPHGFQELQTNEPNICLKPENLFMARMGAKVSAQKQQQFKWLRFGVTP